MALLNIFIDKSSDIPEVIHKTFTLHDDKTNKITLSHDVVDPYINIIWWDKNCK